MRHNLFDENCLIGLDGCNQRLSLRGPRDPHEPLKLWLSCLILSGNMSHDNPTTAKIIHGAWHQDNQ